MFPMSLSWLYRHYFSNNLLYHSLTNNLLSHFESTKGLVKCPFNMIIILSFIYIRHNLPFSSKDITTIFSLILMFSLLVTLFLGIQWEIYIGAILLVESYIILSLAKISILLLTSLTHKRSLSFRNY